MGLIRRIVRTVRRVVGGAINAVVGFASKALSTVTQGFNSLMQGCLCGMPFGNLLKGFAGQFLCNPFAFTAGATLGALGALFGCATSHRQLADASQHCCHSQAYEHPCARQNMAYMMAYNQARIMSANGWYA